LVKIDSLILQGRQHCEDVLDAFMPSPAQNMKLVYLYGATMSDKNLIDEEFGIEVENCVRLVRKVEMFQWVKVNGKYVGDWRSNLVSSEE
jgi:hypothetical protein